VRLKISEVAGSNPPARRHSSAFLYLFLYAKRQDRIANVGKSALFTPSRASQAGGIIHLHDRSEPRVVTVPDPRLGVLSKPYREIIPPQLSSSI
jgi:hypothetical protein